MYYSPPFFVVWSHLLNPVRSGLANLDASHSKPQIDNVTLRQLFVPKIGQGSILIDLETNSKVENLIVFRERLNKLNND